MTLPLVPAVASSPPRALLDAGGIDARWSRVVDVPGTPTRSWHLLDNAATLAAEPVGTLLCVHGNPTWSYLWRRLVAAGARGERPWRVVAVDQLEMGFSERTGDTHRLADRVAELGALTDALGLSGPGGDGRSRLGRARQPRLGASTTRTCWRAWCSPTPPSTSPSTSGCLPCCASRWRRASCRWAR